MLLKQLNNYIFQKEKTLKREEKGEKLFSFPFVCTIMTSSPFVFSPTNAQHIDGDDDGDEDDEEHDVDDDES